MLLRPYQQVLFDKIRKEIMSGKKKICAVLGCGGGKSVIQGTIAKSATEKGNRVLFLVHRKELCEQITETFEKCGVDFKLCEVSMVQTITRHIDKLIEPSLIITDEAHHALSETYQRIYDYFPNAIRLGFTATPMRMNEGGLGKVFETLVESVSTQWLIDNKFLAPYKYFSVKLADTNGLNVKRGDFDSHEIAELMEKSFIYGETIKNYVNIANNKKTIVYCASIEASIKTAKEFNDNGITAEHLDGTTPKAKRQEVTKAFKNGDITVLCNVDLFGEGFDVPDCECVVLLRPTKSLTLFIQQSMRSMRYKDNKQAIIIDHVGNVFEHGFPDDDRQWSLESKKKKKKNDVNLKECPTCYYCMSSKERVCPECGHEFMTLEQQEKQLIAIQLQELRREDILAMKPYQYYTKIKTFEEMQAFQKAKKYKFAWTIHKCLEQKIEIPDKYNYMVERWYA